MHRVLATLLVLATLGAQEQPLPDFDTLVAQVKNRLQTDEGRQSGYAFVERRIEQRLDGSGRVQRETVKVFDVYPGLPGQDRYRRLIEQDGKPVPADSLAKQDRERQQEAEAYARRLSTAPEREKASREIEKDRRRYSAAVDDIFRVFEIHVVGRDSLDGHRTILATLTPKADAKPQTDDGKIMRHFKARAWISEADYELVRADIEAIDTLSFGLGLVARVQKGTVATYQRRKVNDEVWLPERVTWTATARVMLVKSLRLRGVAEFSKYRKFTVDTSTTYTPPPG